ncbi:DUF2218 domain-containing protein [Azospirillum sp. SYSU D00513]|uniref:DUF2218 domain-containing protein n=1 Tax=Azospirillum sp. SYSU D00513 TaxID=2812561 RepID=UPI001A96B86E|nr:DUF2218 domain-containing protein [Azospirillum sp. SYSU D00513]
MLETATLFETEHGQRYAGQLCKHFAHKIEVVPSEEGGECRFSCGTAALRAEAGGLRIRVSAPTAEGLAETKAVIESHLLRFAFREGERRLDWSA